MYFKYISHNNSRIVLLILNVELIDLIILFSIAIDMTYLWRASFCQQFYLYFDDSKAHVYLQQYNTRISTTVEHLCFYNSIPLVFLRATSPFLNVDLNLYLEKWLTYGLKFCS